MKKAVFKPNEVGLFEGSFLGGESTWPPHFIFQEELI